MVILVCPHNERLPFALWHFVALQERAIAMHDDAEASDVI
jgi:hypothetical protein